MQETIVNSSNEEDILERIVKNLARKLSPYKGLLFASWIIGAIAGVVVSFFVTKKFTCSVQILPEFNSGSSGSGFSSLASLAGIDLSQNAKKDAFRPDLYPNVLKSTTAVIHLLRQPVNTIDKKKYKNMIQYLDSFSEKKILAGELQSDMVNPPLWHFNASEKNMIEKVRGSIKTSFDKKSGIVVLEVEMEDPEIAANSTVILTNYLKNFLADYRIQKKRDQSKFLKTRVDEALANLERSEYALQSYRDKNRNIVVNVARIQEQKLQSEFMQRQSIYNELIKQSEKSKIEELQEEDVLITVESPMVPLSKSRPSRLLFGVGGSILSFLFVLTTLLFPWKRLFFKRSI